MKKLSTLVLNLVFVFGGASVAMAESSSKSAARQDLQLLEKFQESGVVAKGILKRRCLKNPEISELCKGSASDLKGADLSEVKEAVVADLEKEAASEGAEEPQMQSQATSVNVSSGNNTQSSNVSIGAYPGAACVAKVTANASRINASLNSRFKNRN